MDDASKYRVEDGIENLEAAISVGEEFMEISDGLEGLKNRYLGN